MADIGHGGLIKQPQPKMQSGAFATQMVSALVSRLR